MTHTSPDRAAQEAAAGRLWRAKEILAGRIAALGYSTERFAAYGRILAQMNDTKEAGKYLFLSGLATPEEAPVVEVFVRLLRGRPAPWIYSQFPGAARKNSLAAYPVRVQTELAQLGFPANFRWRTPAEAPVPLRWWQSAGIAAMVLTFIFLLMTGLIHGCSVVDDWIFGK
ncbi:MAG TPA: hypothetical protein VG734_06555 [Lacunisphaera sp.]|nr:hypothetical protein [Lacunisphaera sp.]